MDNEFNSNAKNNVNTTRSYYVAAHRLASAVNTIDNLIDDEDTVMISNLETGELLAQCIGEHIWSFYH